MPISTDDFFEAGTFGTTLARSLLRSLSFKNTSEALAILDKSLAHTLLRTGFTKELQPILSQDIEQWIGGMDAKLEYQYMQLIIRAYSQPSGNEDLLISAMAKSYEAGDYKYAKEIALGLIQETGILVPLLHNIRGNDILGRIYSDESQFEKAAIYFEQGAQSAHNAGLANEEWDLRTNLIWCLYVQEKHLEVLKETVIAEKLARQINSPDALAKTLLDRGNSNMRLGRYKSAKEAFEATLKVAEQSANLERQSDALGNLGIIALFEKDYKTAELYHKRSLAISETLGDTKSFQYDLNNVSQAYWLQDRSQEAVDALEKALEIATQRKDKEAIDQYKASLQRMYQGIGKYVTAQSFKKEASDQDFTNPKEQNSKKAEVTLNSSVNQAIELDKQVRLLLNAKNVAGARQLLEKYLVENSADWQGRCLYGVVLIAMGNDASGRDQFRQAILLAPDALDPYYRMVDSYARTCELDVLAKEYEERISNAPFHIGVRMALALIYTYQNQYDDAIQLALEATRRAPHQELLYRVLAEAQLAKANSLLRSNWDGAWLIFQNAMATLLELVHLGKETKGQWASFAARSLENFAIDSHMINPPITVQGMDSRELEVLMKSDHFYFEANQCDSWRPYDAGRIPSLIADMAQPEQITKAAINLSLDNWIHEAQILLYLSLDLDSKQAEAYYQLSLLVDEEDGNKALDFIKFALHLDPTNVIYQQAIKEMKRKTTSFMKNYGTDPH